MIDIKLNYQASIFTNASEIIPNAYYIQMFVMEFADLGFIPSTFQELSNLGSQTRLSLKTSTNEWGVEFGTNRIDFIKKGVDAKGNNLGNEAEFCEKVIEIFSKIHAKTANKSNRLALSSSVLLKEFNSKEKDRIYKKLNNPSPTYKSNNPTEWNNRVSSTLTKTVCGRSEKINYISQVNRIKGVLRQENSPVEIDKIEVKLDINTHQNDLEYRFDLKGIKEFFTEVSEWHSELQLEIIEFLK